MRNPSLERKFTGSIPQVYETYLVPMIFRPYATDLADRLRAVAVTRVLEIAAGTGVVTRAMAATLPATVSIVATDLNQAMLDQAARIGSPQNVEWRQSDAMHLPYDDESFDAAVCQFGVMFFPNRSNAYAEVKRVLRPGGTFLFNAWDRLEANEFPHAVQRAVEHVFPADPPRFLAQVPHGYSDTEQIARDLAQAGFAEPASIATVGKRSHAESAHFAATGFCHGTPLRNQIEARDAARLAEAVDVATAMLAQRFGDGAIDGAIQAHVVQIRK